MIEGNTEHPLFSRQAHTHINLHTYMTHHTHREGNRQTHTHIHIYLNDTYIHIHKGRYTKISVHRGTHHAKVRWRNTMLGFVDQVGSISNT